MIINTDPENFVAINFVIVNFYGKDTCFIWNESEFICFPYTLKTSTDKIKVLNAPAKIKKICSFNERVFILCMPNGIYKLTDNFEFASLSKAGVELGANFCEVFTPNNGMVVLEDKKLKIVKKLFPVCPSSDLHVLPLNHPSTDETLRKTLLPDDSTSTINLCIIAYGKKLFKMYNQMIQIIYNCDYSIKKIEPVEKHGKIVGAIFITDSKTVIFMHAINKKLSYLKISLECNVQILCAVIDPNLENVLFLVYSDNIRTYYSRRSLNENSVQEIRAEETCYECFKVYNSNIVYLKSHNELFEVNAEVLSNAFSNKNNNDFVKLAQHMLSGINDTIETITNKTMELKKLKESLIEKEDNLKRINLFVKKQHILYCPEESVIRMLNQTFLISNFKKILPKNSIVVKMLKSRGKSIFSMKDVEEHDTVVEMSVSVPNLSSKLYSTTDLITYKNDPGIWCLIKHYVQDPLPSKSSQIHLTSEKRSFVKHKLFILKNLIKENNFSMETLSKLKIDIRNEINIGTSS